jgi:hypothetical protein
MVMMVSRKMFFISALTPETSQPHTVRHALLTMCVFCQFTEDEIKYDTVLDQQWGLSWSLGAGRPWLQGKHTDTSPRTLSILHSKFSSRSFHKPCQQCVVQVTTLTVRNFFNSSLSLPAVA